MSGLSYVQNKRIIYLSIPPRAQSQASPSIFGRFASSVRAAPSIHPSNMFDNPSPNRRVLDQTLFSQNLNFLATP